MSEDSVLFKNENPMNGNNSNPTMSGNPSLDYSSSAVLGKVFLYMGIGVLITALVSILGGYFLREWFLTIDVDADNYIAIFIGFIIAIIVFLIGINILPYIIQRGAKKKAAAHVWIPYIIYSVLFGGFLAFFAIFLSPVILGSAFLITAVVYFVMALVGILSKGKLKVLYQIMIGLGAGLMILISIYVVLFIFSAFFNELFWGNDPNDLGNTLTWINLAIFGGIFLYSAISTIVSTRRLKDMTKNYVVSANQQVFFAFCFYSNYISMLMFILRILVLVVARRR